MNILRVFKAGAISALLLNGTYTRICNAEATRSTSTKLAASQAPLDTPDELRCRPSPSLPKSTSTTGN